MAVCLRHLELYFQHSHSLTDSACKSKAGMVKGLLAHRKPCIQFSTGHRSAPCNPSTRWMKEDWKFKSSSLHIEFEEAQKAAPTLCLGSEQWELLEFLPTCPGAASIRNPGRGIITDSHFQEPTCPRWQRPFKTAVTQHPHR